MDRADRGRARHRGGWRGVLPDQPGPTAGWPGHRLQKVGVVVAARPIAARKPIEAEDVVVRQIPLDETNTDVISIRKPEEVIGRVLAVTVFQGQMITSNMLASTTSGGQFTILEPNETIGPTSEAWRAVSMTVPDDRAVGGLLDGRNDRRRAPQRPGQCPHGPDGRRQVLYGQVDQDHVPEHGHPRQGRHLLHREGDASRPRRSPTSGCRQRPRSASAAAEADVRLVDASKLGETTNKIIAKYGLPIPENFPPGNGPIPTPQPTPARAAPAPAARARPLRRVPRRRSRRARTRRVRSAPPGHLLPRR